MYGVNLIKSDAATFILVLRLLKFHTASHETLISMFLGDNGSLHTYTNLKKAHLPKQCVLSPWYVHLCFIFCDIFWASKPLLRGQLKNWTGNVGEREREREWHAAMGYKVALNLGPHSLCTQDVCSIHWASRASCICARFLTFCTSWSWRWGCLRTSHKIWDSNVN